MAHRAASRHREGRLEGRVRRYMVSILTPKCTVSEHDHHCTSVRLAKAWSETPTKWYPLPIAVGALLLIVMQYRKRMPPKEVHVDEEGREVVRLKGPWQVCFPIFAAHVDGVRK